MNYKFKDDAATAILIIQKSLEVFYKNAALMLGICFILWGGPSLLFHLAYMNVRFSVSWDIPYENRIIIVLTFGVLSLVGMTVAQASLIRVNFSYLKGISPKLYGSVTDAVSVLVPLFAANVICMSYVLLGLFVFIVPGLIIYFRLSLVASVLVIEKNKVFLAISKSNCLARQFFFLIFLVQGSILGFGFLINFILNRITIYALYIFSYSIATYPNYRFITEIPIITVNCLIACIGISSQVSLYCELINQGATMHENGDA